jgi:hypothetical protein
VRRRPILYLNISSLRTRGKIWRELKGIMKKRECFYSERQLDTNKLTHHKLNENIQKSQQPIQHNNEQVRKRSQNLTSAAISLLLSVDLRFVNVEKNNQNSSIATQITRF